MQKSQGHLRLELDPLSRTLLDIKQRSLLSNKLTSSPGGVGDLDNGQAFLEHPPNRVGASSTFLFFLSVAIVSPEVVGHLRKKTLSHRSRIIDNEALRSPGT